MAVSHPHPNQQRLVAQPAAFRPPAFASRAFLRPLGNWAFLAVGLPAGEPPDPIGVVMFRM